MAEKICVASGKGGVGKSTVAVLISKELAKRGKRVLLCDLDVFSTCDILLGVSDKVVFNLNDVMQKRCDISDAVIECSGVSLLVAPEDYKFIKVSEFKELILALEDGFDFIIFDSPAGNGIGFLLGAECCERALIVATNEPASIKSAEKIKNNFFDCGTKTVNLIINQFKQSRFKSKNFEEIDNLIDSVGVKLIGVVSFDSKIKRFKQGEIPFDEKMSSFRGISNITTRLLGEKVSFNQ